MTQALLHVLISKSRTFAGKQVRVAQFLSDFTCIYKGHYSPNRISVSKNYEFRCIAQILIPGKRARKTSIKCNIA